MRFDASLQQRLEQRMILAPRMIQAMEILQLPLMALQERIDQELIANPVLELRDGDRESATPESDEAAEEAIESAAPVAEAERELVVRDDDTPEEFERLSELVDRWDNYFEEAGPARSRSRASSDDVDPKAAAMQNAPDTGGTLQEHMLAEWRLEDTPPRLVELGELIIRNLDDNGYLRVGMEALASEAVPPATPEEMEEALHLVQQAGPAGVGARSIEECLLLQIVGRRPADDEDGDAAPSGKAVSSSGSPAHAAATAAAEQALDVRLIRDHLRDIEANRYPQMSKTLNVSIADIQASVQRIRRLNPKPGTVINPRRTPPIIPDVVITWDEETGQYRVSIQDGDTPELYISRAYRRLIKQRDLDTPTRQFVARNIRSARWLMDAIEQRRDTLRRVVESIIKYQRPFFDDGPEAQRPLKMQEVADDVHLHVGTISRAVSDKYAETPWGIWPLRDFFTGGTQTSEGQEVSWDQIRLRLKAIIDAEDKADPLSDDTIVDKLQAEGIALARRTVAKYREEMGIPSSRRRRTFQ
jgi:RNA polymerase sigma-54 factor